MEKQLTTTTQEKEMQLQLDDWLSRNKLYTQHGKCASYIPALQKANPTDLGICMISQDGTILKSGHVDTPFTLQSISKVISFIQVCIDHGISEVLEYVDVEPTGDAFNSIIRLEMSQPGRPFNPMINAGAITVSSMLKGDSPTEKLNTILQLVEKMIGKRPTINHEVFQSEWETSNRNRSLAYWLKETGYLKSEVEETLEVYLKQCAIEMTAHDLAIIGLVLAQDGKHPFTQEQIIPKKVTRLAKTLMLTCGMYNYSGKFAAFVGIPAKSGVSGGIMAAVPPRSAEKTPFSNGWGIGVYGPAIDQYGNSTGGVMLLKELAENWDMGIF
ncbi:glutaminase [Bacillus pinisoli]|uniref:glutaminase n=1 Tax=Bacillus pinisoli TaxID=2901866 RepID=UPI001FF1A9B5|nr:glutaminase [Bacillus pinisoli]